MPGPSAAAMQSGAAAQASSRADTRYGASSGAQKPVDKNSNAYVDPYIEKMKDEEAANYDALKKKGLSTDDALYHATNPSGRLFSDSATPANPGAPQ